jgi:hypothetical protein
MKTRYATPQLSDVCSHSRATHARHATCPDPRPAVVEAKGVQPIFTQNEAPGVARCLGCHAAVICNPEAVTCGYTPERSHCTATHLPRSTLEAKRA